MPTYNLSSNQADRIQYDIMYGQYFYEQIKQYVTAGGNIHDIDRTTFNAWFDVQQEDVDDTDEADARAWFAFHEQLDAAKFQRLNAD